MGDVTPAQTLGLCIMTRSPEMVTNAAQLHNRFFDRLALHYMRALEAKLSYAETRTQHSKHMYEVNRHCAVTVVACYGDAMNMTFEQARTALGMSQTMLDTLP